VAVTRLEIKDVAAPAAKIAEKLRLFMIDLS
jgi:hypothetical protein